MFFTSDNAGPAHPDILAALEKTNEAYANPYGNDAVTEAAVTRIKDVFEAPKAAVYFVGTGTAANALALATLANPWEAVFTYRLSHAEEDECGAPEFFTGGAKLALIGGKDGKLCPDQLRARIERTQDKGVHGVQSGPITLAQITEHGTLYKIEEIRAITKIAREFNLKTHMDGARFANACAALEASPADVSWRAGVDALSFGGTKNGLFGAEAVILFDPAEAWEFELRRKRGGHLFSKNRFLAAQMLAYVSNDLWLKTAQAANGNGAHLAKALAELPGVKLDQPCDANMVFASLPRRMHRVAIAAGAQYYLIPMASSLDGPDDELISARFVCDWSLKHAEIDRFLELLKAA